MSGTSPRSPRLLGRSASVILASAGLVLLAACSSPEPQATPSPTTSPSATAEPTTEPSATSEPTATPDAFSADCTQLLSNDDVYAYNPNVGAAPDFEPTTAAALAVVESGGVACGLLNQSSGATVEFAVAKPGEAVLSQRNDEAAVGSTWVPTYGTPPDVDGYFSATGGHGEAQAFTGPFWIVVDSTEFLEPGDAASLVEAIRANIASL
ncbi:iron ABC transporter ATP-binding protein [Agromyces atrinae]|uniref:iron ABC transporter ATP-binding protein n=1 Tax=Agromyces atrinae TaxID=592376 RepID=UPI001F582CA0|nr:iron ABC transporter ATP-binding protein [Agromyces atrinae]MCI2958115.1 iron ABC transporter ATP-binding protein [Agromyces atrinae]